MRIAVQLGEALAARGHRVHLFARKSPLGIDRFGPGVMRHWLAPDGDREPPSSRLDVHWTREELGSLLGRVLSVAGSEGLDVLHFHYAVPFAAVAAGVRRRLRGSSPRLVGTLHGTDVSDFGLEPGIGPTLASALADLDALTTVSRSHAALATSVFGLARPPRVIPNFVDVRRFRPSPGGLVPPAHRPPRIIHVSNFRPVKAPERVARVFARVRRRLDAELWLVGDGEGMDAVRSILRAEGLEANVRFFGLRKAIEAILREADLLLVTSRSESFCLVALEAAACGLPVVGPRVGGLPEVVVHGETGLLFEGGDDQAAAEAVVSILGDAATASAMGRAAVQRARSFASDLIVSRYERLYLTLVGGGRVGGADGDGSPARGQAPVSAEVEMAGSMATAPRRRDASGAAGLGEPET